jgi:hypothetical protein
MAKVFVSGFTHNFAQAAVLSAVENAILFILNAFVWLFCLATDLIAQTALVPFFC